MKQQLGLQEPLDFGPQFVNSRAVLTQKFLGSKWLLPRPRTGTEESGSPLLITVRTARVNRYQQEGPLLAPGERRESVHPSVGDWHHGES